MCYVCMGCGACGKHKSELFDVPAKCLICGAELETMHSVCPECGFVSGPGVKIAPGAKPTPTGKSTA